MDKTKSRLGIVLMALSLSSGPSLAADAGTLSKPLDTDGIARAMGKAGEMIGDGAYKGFRCRTRGLFSAAYKMATRQGMRTGMSRRGPSQRGCNRLERIY